MRVRCRKVEPVLVNADPTMADVKSLVRGIGVVPDLMSRPRVNRPDVVRHGDVHDAVLHDGNRFDGARLVRLEGPGEGHPVDVARVDLRERAVAADGIVAVITQPRVLRY